jgi:NhaP-type Na+/H+ or K+/H+ antiporter
MTIKKPGKFIELLQSGESTKLSSSTLWFHIANIAVSIVYIMLGIAVYKMPTPNIEGMAIFTAVYAGIVTSNKFANAFLSYKYNQPSKNTKRDVVSNEDN